MYDVMTHFGHRPREFGNMICPWHDEMHPSAKLYHSQDTFWCFVCSPNHGVDQLEFIAIEQQFEWDVDPTNQLSKAKRHSIATIKSLEYVETELGIALELEPWEGRLSDSLRPKPVGEDPARYWRSRHEGLLRALATSSQPDRFSSYSAHLAILVRLKHSPLGIQQTAWSQALRALTTPLEPTTPQGYNHIPNPTEGAVTADEQLMIRPSSL